jgi:hypothetical protein
MESGKMPDLGKSYQQNAVDNSILPFFEKNGFKKVIRHQANSDSVPDIQILQIDFVESAISADSA